MDAEYELVIGDKNLSSWSLRPWLVLTVFGIPFKEIVISLRRPSTKQDILRHSSSGKVPALKSGGLVLWDSLAIIEFVAERHPNAAIWPKDAEARAIARCTAAEMHSGFYALRNEFPMDFINVLGFPDASDKALADIERIVAIWMECRKRFGGAGAFLFGDFSAADAMFAPVASRFTTYEADLARFGDDGTAARYRDLMMALPAMRLWREGAEAEI
ncbi:MAG: glutathione S-transferase family protein [Rhodomicrobium sp.]|nr:glutathione S-transferase family protein [Rhodomicrobium sp.]